MSDKPKRGTFIHGIAASEHLDSSGERIKIDGVDITSLTKDGTFNYEHDSKSPSSIVGKIWEAKKILKRADCDNDSQKYFWDKIKMPFIYVAGELFDSVGHASAADVAAMLRYDQLDVMNKDAKKLINFSIEGSRVEKTGQIITKCIARKVSVTLTPCNKVCEAEELKIDDGAKKESASGEFTFVQDMMSKADEPSCEIMKGEIPFLYQNTEISKAEKKPHPKDPVANYDKLGPKAPSEAKQKEYIARVKTTMSKKEPTPKQKKQYAAPKGAKIAGTAEFDPRHMQGGKTLPEVSKKSKLGKYDSSVRKALTASCGMGAPSAKVQDVSKSEFLYKNEDAAMPNQGSKIGTTKSGKNVFSNAKIADYKGFSPQDHAEAADFHRQMVLKTPSFKDKEMHMNKMRLHNSAFSTSREKEIKMQGMSKTPGAIPRPQAMANAKIPMPGMPKPASPGAVPQTPAKGVMGFSASATNYAKPAAIPPTAAPAAPMAKPAMAAPPAMAPAVPNPNMKMKMAKSEVFLIRKLGEADVNKASKNVREQRKKVFGSKSQPGANTAMREKHIQHIKQFVDKHLGLDLQPSGGKVDDKTGQRRNEENEEGVDKPDWRSGKFEAQWNPEAIVHEIAHLMLLPKGVGLEEGQRLMDKQYSDVQKEHGYMQQKRSKYEVQPMAAEQLIRRAMGLPPSQVSIPVKSKDDPHRVALEDPTEKIATRIQSGKSKDGTPKYVDLIRQSRNLHPEHKQRLADIFSGKLQFDPDKGWGGKNKSLDAAITNRQPGAVMARQNKKVAAAPAPTELPPNVVRMKPKAAPAAPAPEAAPQEQPPMKIAKSERRAIMKMLGDQAFEAFEKKEELMAFLAEKLPNLSEKERKAIAKAVAYTSEKNKELSLKSLLGEET